MSTKKFKASAFALVLASTQVLAGLSLSHLKLNKATTQRFIDSKEPALTVTPRSELLTLLDKWGTKRNGARIALSEEFYRTLYENDLQITKTLKEIDIRRLPVKGQITIEF